MKVIDIVLKIVESVVIVFASFAMIYEVNRQYKENLRKKYEKEIELERRLQGGGKYDE